VDLWGFSWTNAKKYIILKLKNNLIGGKENE